MVKRYYLVERLGVESRVYDNYDDYKALESAINKYNQDKKNKLLCSKPNLTINNENETFEATFTKYRKILKEASSLKEIDDITTSYNNLNELKEFLFPYLKDSRHLVQVVFKYNKDLNNEHILYSKDKSYLDINNIRSIMYEEVNNRNIKFFNRLCYDKTFTSNPYVLSKLEVIENALEHIEYDVNPLLTMNKPIEDFINIYIYKNNEINYSALRSLALFVMKNKSKNEVKEEVYEQLKFSLEKL